MKVYVVLINMEEAFNKVKVYRTLKEAQDAVVAEYTKVCEEYNEDQVEVVWEEDDGRWYVNIDEMSAIEECELEG